MKKYKVTQLDKRHNGHLNFKYSISPTSKDFLQSRRDFQELREWLWANYGPSSERDWAQVISNTDNTDLIWAWDTEYNNKRLYIRGDVELTFLQLKFN